MFLIDASKPTVEKKNNSKLVLSFTRLLRGNNLNEIFLFVLGLLTASKTSFKRYEKIFE